MQGYIWIFQQLNDILGISLQDYILKSFIHYTSNGTRSCFHFPQKGIATLKLLWPCKEKVASYISSHNYNCGCLLMDCSTKI